MTIGLEIPSSTTARLPVVYEHAKEALAACSRIDECAEWANKAEAIASYARQADDETMFQMATRIKARAIRRCGELLREIPAKVGRPVKNGGDAPTNRTREANAAGLSTDQRHQALRVAAVSEPEFEAAVEAPKPATVTELAARGTKPSTAHLQGRDPAEFQASTRAQAVLKDLAEIAGKTSAAIAVRGSLPHEWDKMAANARAVASWVAALQTELEATQ